MRVLAIGWRGTADERCVGAQRPKRCKPVQALARVACAVPPALLARGGNGHATRAPSVQRVYMGGVCKQARMPLLRSRRCSTPAAVRRTVLESLFLHSCAWMAGSAGKIWAPCTCTCLSTFSATARNDHWADRSIVWFTVSAIEIAFLRCKFVSCRSSPSRNARFSGQPQPFLT